MKNFRAGIFTAALLLQVAACNGGGGGDADTDALDGESEDGTTENGECTPMTCADLGPVCGTFDDGCGGIIECLEACACTDETFETDCPDRACEAATGCDSGICVYSAISCAGEECLCLMDECGDYDLRSCGDRVCAGQYCDPLPLMEDGVVTFRNRCVNTAEGACGTCGLGLRSCDVETDTMVCDDIELPGIDPDMVECDSTLPGSTFIFVDPDYTGDDSDGSRNRPYLTVDVAVDDAAARNARAVIIGGSPTFTTRPDFESGISVYGGYGHYPEFIADRDQRPAWEIGQEYQEDGRLVGVMIRNIDRATILAHLDFRTASIAGEEGSEGACNYGLYVDNAPELRLLRVNVRAGDAGHGADGEDGTTPALSPSLMNGADGQDSDCYYGTSSTTCNDSRSNGGAGAPGGGCSWNTLGLCLPHSGGVGGGTFNTWHLYTEGGEAAPAGAGGGEGGHWIMTIPQFSLSEPGADGDDASVLEPVHGDAGLPGEELLDGYVVPTGSGSDGATGRAGGGGGGGGSGGSWYDFPDPQYICISGSGGGGGGAGGCGGTGGGGGQHGGYSIGLFLADSGGIVLRDCDVQAGDGGSGGDGGAGGAGASGGTGGSPGEPPTPSSCTPCGIINCAWARGAEGGAGGGGQDGGDGGGGAGGSTIGVYCLSTNPTLEGETVFGAASPGTGGMSGLVAGHDGHAVTQRGCMAECGNGFVEAGEECDDGNTEGGDGCESDCTALCGDGIVMGLEQCDDGNTEGGDGCESDCTALCGDGIVMGLEQCDDGNTDPGDGCESSCTTLCGDGIIAGSEECDDGNREAGDGCSLECLFECGAGALAVTSTYATSSHTFYPHLGAVDPATGNCFVSFNTDVSQAITWYQAENGCQSVHGHLVTLGSSAEQDLAKSLVPSAYSTMPIGLKERPMDGYWYWMDRVYSGFTNWASGHPSIAVDDLDCGYIMGSTWRDLSCSIFYGHPFVCEIPMTCP